jgi:choline dehydrogenase-like flavoprotein
MSNYDCDVVIVGAGISGAMIAYKLASQGFKVIILEAGIPFADRQPYIEGYYRDGWPWPSAELAPTPADPGSNWKVPAYNYWVQTGAYAFDSTYERRGGGTTMHWLGTCMRFVPNDFKLHSLYNVQDAMDWPIGYADLEPWYTAAEAEIGVSGDGTNQYPFEGTRSKPYPMPPIPASYLDQQFGAKLNNNKVTLNGVTVPLTVGLTPQGRNSIVYDARPACMGNSSCVPICPIQAKYDATVHLGKATGAATPAEIRYRSVVTGLTVDPATASISGISYVPWTGEGSGAKPGPAQTVTARRYVLAAHAIETVKILLMSPWRTDGGKPVTVANSSDQVGRNLMDHICNVVWGTMPQPVYPYRGPLATSGIENFRDTQLRSQYAAFRIEIGNDGWSWPTGAPQTTVADIVTKQGLFGAALRQAVQQRGWTQFRMALELESITDPTSRVTLSDQKDALGLNRPQLNYHLSDYTLNGWVASVDAAKQILGYLGATDATTVDNTAAGYFEYQGNCYQYRGAGHVIGTYRMGNDAKNSVVDAMQKSHDHANLYLVGSGTFPTTGTANPTLTVTAMALRTADAILSELKASP